MFQEMVVVYCFKTFYIVQVMERGRLFVGSEPAPFLVTGCTIDCFQDVGKHFLFIINRNSLLRIGDSSEAHSLRTRGGTPSEPYALLMLSFDRARTRQIGIMVGFCLC